MPRKRTSTEAPKERAKLDTAEQVNVEIRKLYRRYANKEITAADLKGRVATLTALRAGMADPVEPLDPAAGRPGIGQLNLIGIPHGWCVVGLFGLDAHMPSETVQQLREMLPGSIGPPPSLNDALPPPIDDVLPHAPMLKVYESDVIDPEPPQAA